MDIEEEINDKAEHIVRLLKKGSFFEEYPFILPVKLKLTLQASMYKKYKSEGVVDLDTKELGLLIHNLRQKFLLETFTIKK